MAFTDTKLSYFHSFSKMPAQNSTTLGNAINKSGHTVTASEVWASDIPYYGKMGSLDDVKSKVQPYARKNDMCYITAGTDKGKTFIYDGEGNWTQITLTPGMLLKNSKDENVLLYHSQETLTNLTADNNANTDSANNAARLWTTVGTDGQTCAKRLVEQFVAPTDKALNGLASVAYAPVIGTLVSGTDFYDYCFSGTILWGTASSSTRKIDCFEYIGPKVSTVVDTVSAHSATIKTHGDEISELKDKLGLSTDTPDGTPTLGGRVSDNETALKVLLGLAEGDKVVATESIATTAANAVSTSLTGTTDGTIGKAIADAKQEALDAINAIQHFSVVVVPEGQTMENVTPVENTIYLVSDSQAADGSYIEYIAFKQGEETKVEKIGSTKLDLSGYTTDEEHEALQGRVSTAEGQIATITSTDATKEGSIAKALADAKTYAEGQASAAESAAKSEASTNLATARTEITAEIAQAKSEAIASAEVTITAGSGIVVTGEGKGTTFEIAVADTIATVAALTAVADTVASNKTELDGKIASVEASIKTINEETIPAAIETAKSETTSQVNAAKSEINGTITTLTGRVSTAEGKITTLEGQVASLTSGDNSVDSKIAAAVEEIEGEISSVQTTLQGNIDGVSGRVTTVEGKVSAIETDLATGATAQAITKAQTDATQALADAATAKTAGETAAAAAQSAVEAKSLASTSTGSDLVKVTTAGTVGTGMTTTVDTTALATAISDAKDAAISAAATAAKAMTLSATDSDDAGKVTVTLGGTVETPTLTVTTSDIASAQTLSDLVRTVNTHIAEAAGLYLSVEKVDTLPADADAKTNKIYLVPVDTEAGRAQNIHTEYIWTNNKWEIIGTTAIDINSLEAAAEAAQTAADKAQGEVDALETVVETLTQTHATDKAALEASIATKTSSVAAGTSDALTGLSVTVDTDATSKAVTVSVDNSAVKGGSIPATAKVVANGLIDGTDAIATEKIAFGEEDRSAVMDFVPTDAQLTTWVGDMPNLESGYEMFASCAALTTFIGDLSALKHGNQMFMNCSLTTFIGDLSSLEYGDNMFQGCKLSTENALEIVESLPTYTSGRHNIRINVVSGNSSLLGEIAELAEAKGWTLTLETDGGTFS